MAPPPPPPDPTVETGGHEITLTVRAGRDLVAKDRTSITRKKTSSDPYVTVYLGDRKLGRTPTRRKTLAPSWANDDGATFVLRLGMDDAKRAGQRFELVVTDEDIGRSDDPMGVVSFPLPTSPMFGREGWFQVQNGEIDSPHYAKKATGQLLVRMMIVEIEPKRRKKKPPPEHGKPGVGGGRRNRRRSTSLPSMGGAGPPPGAGDKAAMRNASIAHGPSSVDHGSSRVSGGGGGGRSFLGAQDEGSAAVRHPPTASHAQQHVENPPPAKNDGGVLPENYSPAVDVDATTDDAMDDVDLERGNASLSSAKSSDGHRPPPFDEGSTFAASASMAAKERTTVSESDLGSPPPPSSSGLLPPAAAALGGGRAGSPGEADEAAGGGSGSGSNAPPPPSPPAPSDRDKPSQEWYADADVKEFGGAAQEEDALPGGDEPPSQSSGKKKKVVTTEERMDVALVWAGGFFVLALGLSFIVSLSSSGSDTSTVEETLGAAGVVEGEDAVPVPPNIDAAELLSRSEAPASAPPPPPAAESLLLQPPPPDLDEICSAGDLSDDSKVLCEELCEPSVCCHLPLDDPNGCHKEYSDVCDEYRGPCSRLHHRPPSEGHEITDKVVGGDGTEGDSK